MKASHSRAALFLVLLLAAGAPASGAPERLTLDWIFSDEGKNAASVPDRAWLDTGIALLYDHRPARPERTIESFDPATGARRRLFDAAKALARMNELLSPGTPFEEVGWPEALDPKGRWVAWEKDDDILLLDLATSRFETAAATDGIEKSARFSPDGRMLAFVRANDLYVRDLEARTEKRLTTDGSPTLLNGTLSWVYWEEIFGRADRGYTWSPDSKSIAYFQTDESGVGLMSFVDFAPNIPRVIHQRYPKAGEANPRVRAGVVDIERALTTWVDLGVYPYEYLSRVSWLPDSRRLAVQTLDRSQTRLDLFFADAATGRVAHVLRETDDGWVNRHDDLHFLKKHDRFVWASERDGFAHLYLYDMDGKLVRQITRGDWATRASGGMFWLRQAVAHIDEQSDRIYFTGLEKSSIERQLYRIRLDGSGMERLTREDGTHAILFRPDGAFYLDAFSAVDRMPSLVLRRPDSDVSSTVAAPGPDLARRFDLPARELFTIAAKDGFKLPAMILKPRSFQPKRKHPAVLYVYGGPSAPTVSNAWGGGARDNFHRLLAQEGYIILQVDNRAASAIGKRFENLIVGDGYGRTELSDLLDAVAWLKDQPYVDADRVGIWGWSGGGSHTLQAMTQSREFRAGVAVAAVTDWRYYDTVWAEAFMKRPQDNPEGYDRTAHAARAKDLHGRLLLVHGTYDDNVHPQNAWRFADELVKAGITFDMMIYPMRKHGITDDAAQKHLFATMREFWLKNLR
ncbi:MAG TPA: S9 family peptidase [Candidatus Polarisedimenticolia bacterium]|nr:S9 family peptidase [Candidatus Polarisedimenticolia bacterium]